MNNKPTRDELRTAALKIADIVADLIGCRRVIQIPDTTPIADDVARKRAEQALKRRGLR